MPASRKVTHAVSAVLNLAPRRGEVSLPRLVEAVSEDRGRPIELRMADLPPGVCGQWRQYVDRDMFLIQKGLPAWDRTLAHELGHLVLGHEGIPVVQAARDKVEIALECMKTDGTMYSGTLSFRKLRRSLAVSACSWSPTM